MEHWYEIETVFCLFDSTFREQKWRNKDGINIQKWRNRDGEELRRSKILEKNCYELTTTKSIYKRFTVCQQKKLFIHGLPSCGEDLQAYVFILLVIKFNPPSSYANQKNDEDNGRKMEIWVYIDLYLFGFRLWYKKRVNEESVGNSFSVDSEAKQDLGWRKWMKVEDNGWRNSSSWEHRGKTKQRESVEEKLLTAARFSLLDVRWNMGFLKLDHLCGRVRISLGLISPTETDCY